VRRFVVIGADSATGSVLLDRLGRNQDVIGIPLEDADCFAGMCSDVTDAVYCGNAAISSWDPEFGDPDTDLCLLPAYCRVAAGAGVRLIHISTDAVFDGPWIFHDEDSPPSCDSAQSRKLRKLEDCVLNLPCGLVVRTNTLGVSEGTFVNLLRQHLNDAQAWTLPSHLYATPLAAARFARLLEPVLLTDATGILHVAGAERLTPWSFAIRLAATKSHDRTLLRAQPCLQPREQSLRCSRALLEFRLRMPTISQTLDDLNESVALSQRQAA